MGYCTNCGQQTDNPDNICSTCSGQSNVSHSSFDSNNNQGQEYNNNSMPINLNKEQTQRDYWTALFDNPMIAFNQIFKGAKPENDFDLGEYEKKFNWGAALGGLFWLSFNSNFWLGLLVGIALCIVLPTVLGVLSFIPIIGLIFSLIVPLALFIGLIVYFGLYGNRITYKTRPYGTLENFNKNQKIWTWAMLGWFAFGMLVTIGSLLAYMGIFLAMIRAAIH